MAESRERLDQPRGAPGLRAPRFDADTFGAYSERLARYFGTARYLTIQSVFVLAWIVFNVVAIGLKFDPYPFILLNLAFSTQAAYAAPLILLAQNRQADRDRIQAEADRARDEQAIADTEYLARELAAVRIAIGEVATRDFVRSELLRLAERPERDAERDREKGRTKDRSKHRDRERTRDAGPREGGALGEGGPLGASGTPGDAGAMGDVGARGDLGDPAQPGV